MKSVALYSKLDTRAKVLHTKLVEDLFKMHSLPAPEPCTTNDIPADTELIYSMGSEPLHRYLPAHLLGDKSFYAMRGTSIWPNPNTRVVITYTPNFVLQNPQTFIDFEFDLILPTKFPIRTQPQVLVNTQVIGADYDALRTVLHTIQDRPRASIDVETSGFNPRRDRLLCIAIGFDADNAAVLTPESWEAYPDLVARIITTNEFVAHNAKFDTRWLRQHITPEFQHHHDTLLMHYILDERIGTHGLKQLCQTRLALPDYERELKSYLKRKADSYDTVPKDVLYRYAGQDACYTVRLFDALLDEIDYHPQSANLVKAYNFLLDAQHTLQEVEEHGFVIDQDALRTLDAHLSRQLEELLAGMERLVPGINPRSFKQVAEYLYDTKSYQAPQMFRDRKPRPTSREALIKLHEAHPDDQFIILLMSYREVQKIHSTYVKPVYEKIDPDGKLRTDFKLHGTVTGRLSSSHPNLQNVPRPTKNEAARLIRNLFCAEPGKVLVGCDYSQAELRVAAIFSREDSMRDIWASGRDLHTETTIDLFGEDYEAEDRMVAKMLNFGVVYGRGASSISVERGISMAEANMLVNKFFRAKPKLHQWLKNLRQQAVTDGYLTTPIGRIRRFGLILPSNEHRIKNQAANFPISSTSSDCAMLAAIHMHQWLKKHDKGELLLLVHDSIYVQTLPEHAHEVGKQLEHFMRTAAEEILGTDWIPLTAEAHTAERWGEL